MLIRLLSSIFLILLCSGADSQVRIRLFYGQDCEAVLLRISDTTHSLKVYGGSTIKLGHGELVLISRAGERIAVNRLNNKGFIADSIQIISTSDTGFIDIGVPALAGSRNEYAGAFTFKSSLGQLMIINSLDMDTYIAGVVQAEAGYKGSPDYFKTQAVIARTYAYMHLGRHANEGYDLCDDIHCQVYHGRSVTGIINTAVSETAGQVLTDSDSILILTPFHSNCGGETLPAEKVWLTAKPYLLSVYDPYCAFSANAAWETDIWRAEWVKYLEEESSMEISEDNDFTFTQNSRLGSYSVADVDIPLKDIRDDWDFRSTFFSIEDKGDTLHFTGRGYGHGVGLCQEGAKAMASRGFTYLQILNFYYNDVYLVNIKDAVIEETIDLSF